MEPTIFRHNATGECVVNGFGDTVWALNESNIKRLFVCANVPPLAGWQCRKCVALYVGLSAKPETCAYCGSQQIDRADLKNQIIARAYELGCSIEVTSHCPELERAGGISAWLRERNKLNRPVFESAG